MAARQEPHGRWSGARAAREGRTGAQIMGGGRARERSSRPTGSGGIGSAQGAQRPSTGRPQRFPAMREAERESARAGRRGLGASEERSARSARAPDGPPDMFDPPPGKPVNTLGFRDFRGMPEDHEQIVVRRKKLQ